MTFKPEHVKLFWTQNPSDKKAVNIGCFLKKFSINVKKKCKKQWKWPTRETNLVQVQQRYSVYFCITIIFESWFFGWYGYGILNVWFCWFWQWPNIMETCSERAFCLLLLFLRNQDDSKNNKWNLLKNHPISCGQKAGFSLIFNNTWACEI